MTADHHTLVLARKNWRKVWREGFVPNLATPALVALRDALRNDDPRLTQGSTTTPPPLMCVQDYPVEAGCALGYMGAATLGGFHDHGKNPNAATVGDVNLFFARCCFDADQRLGEAAACRFFLTWFDDEARPVVLADLAAEITAELERREAKEQPAEVSDLVTV